MSLNKTLDRLFYEIRREAKRNSDFADRLDAVLRLHVSRRDVDDDVVAEVSSPVYGGGPERSEGEGASASNVGALPLSRRAPRAASSPPRDRKAISDSGNAGREAAGGGRAETPAVRAPLNPVAMLKHEGEAALAAALAAQGMPALRALVAEHNLDPSGETANLDCAGLAAHVVAQAKRRAERDEKLFDY